MATKICRKCNRDLPLSSFQRRTKAKDGLQRWCRTCLKTYLYERRKANREVHNRKQSERHKRRRYPDYGTTYDEFQVYVKEIGGRCEICGEKKPLVPDHDHLTGKFRGALCSQHNRALAQFGDGSLVAKLVQYLAKT